MLVKNVLKDCLIIIQEDFTVLFDRNGFTVFQKFSGIWRGYRNGTVGLNGLKLSGKQI